MSTANASAKTNISADVESYISRLDGPGHVALSEMRAIVRGAAPEAVELISYGMPAYHHHGPLLYFGAAAKHCGLYGISREVLASFEERLKPYSKTLQGTVRFPIGKPLPAGLIADIVRACVAENEAKHRTKEKSAHKAAG